MLGFLMDIRDRETYKTVLKLTMDCHLWGNISPNNSVDIIE